MSKLEYAKYMANLMGKKINASDKLWDTMTEQEINEYITNLEVEKPKDTFVVIPRFKEEIRRKQNENLLYQIAQRQKDINNSRRYINDCIVNIGRYESAISDHYSSIEELTEQVRLNSNLSQEDKDLQINIGNFFTPCSDAGSYTLWLKTPELSLNFDYKGTIYPINFGRLQVELRLLSKRALVHPFENNISVDGVYFPYISSGGSICFGNKQELAQEYMNTYQFDKFLELLAGLLTNYGIDTVPYIKLEEFAIKQARLKNDESYFCLKCNKFKHLCLCSQKTCVVCGLNEDDCECRTCEYCGCKYNPDEQSNDSNLHDKCYCEGCDSETGEICDCYTCVNCGDRVSPDNVCYRDEDCEDPYCSACC